MDDFTFGFCDLPSSNSLKHWRIEYRGQKIYCCVLTLPFGYLDLSLGRLQVRIPLKCVPHVLHKIDKRIKEKPTNNDLGKINKAIVEVMQQHHISPTENPFSYSVVTVFLLQKGWKKQEPRGLMCVDNGRGKRDYVAQVGEIRRRILIAKAEWERMRINGKLTKKRRRSRAMLKEECKQISAAELVSYMEKQRSLLRKLKRGIYRRQKHEEARRVSHQFKVDVGQVYTDMREVLNKDKGNEHPKYTPADNKNAEGKLFENIEDASSFWIQLWKSQGTGNRNAQWLVHIRSAIYSRVPPHQRILES